MYIYWNTYSIFTHTIYTLTQHLMHLCSCPSGKHTQAKHTTFIAEVKSCRPRIEQSSRKAKMSQFIDERLNINSLFHYPRHSLVGLIHFKAKMSNITRLAQTSLLSVFVFWLYSLLVGGKKEIERPKITFGSEQVLLRFNNIGGSCCTNIN